MEQACDLLRVYLRVTHHITQQFRSHFTQYNLTFPQAMVLTVLGETGPIPISKLAERTGSANSTISGIVDRLERLGLARREHSEKDRRVIYVMPTEEYQKTARATLTSVDEYFGSVVSGLTPEEKNRIREAMLLLDKAVQSQMPEAGEEGMRHETV